MKTIITSLIVLFTTQTLAGTTPYVPTGAQKKAAKTITEQKLFGHIRFLSSDLLEGRGPASNGDRLSQEYIAGQFELLGLEPAAKDGTYYQPFDLVGITSQVPNTITFKNGSKSVTVKANDEFMGFTGTQSPTSTINNAELVFVGYGIVAPEYNWDDYKDVDVKGKVLVMMNNDPESDPKMFEGKTRLYYGRWTYKYEIAAQKGAAGAIIIHTQPSAGYPWQVVRTSWGGEQFELPAEGQPTTQVEAWTTEEASKKIAALSGHNLDTLRAAAEKSDFRPVPLGTTLSLTMNNKIRKVNTANVVGLLRGSDKKLSEEVVVYMAHHDHLGIKADAKKGEDAIYNGAMDNATGTAGILSIAYAFASLPKPPKRSILFAAVGAEEQGLIGSKYLARHPVVEPGNMAACINIDGMSILGRTKDLTFIGMGKSSLDKPVKMIAKMQSRKVKPDQFPDRGYFYRSDQFSLAKIGVPCTFLEGGIEIVGKPEGWGKKKFEEWESKHYHQPSDEISSEWDLSGAVEDVQLMFYLGYSIAKERKLPKWKEGDEFEAARKQALEKVGKKL